jgi:hypothetical protein
MLPGYVYKLSVVDFLLDPLDPVVPVRSPFVCSIEDNVSHVLCRFKIVHMQCKPFVQVIESLWEEAW